MLTQAELQSQLFYEDGFFKRLVSNNRKHLIGQFAGTIRNDGYEAISINKKIYKTHRLVWLYFYGNFPNGVIDHINGNKTDNRIENLRDISFDANRQNQKKSQRGNISGYLGVSWDKKSNKWKSQIKTKGKNYHLGFFDNPKNAYEIYLEAKRKIHIGCTI